MVGQNSFDVCAMVYAILNLPKVGPATLKKAIGESLLLSDASDILDSIKRVTNGRCDYSIDSVEYKNGFSFGMSAVDRAHEDGQTVVSLFDEAYPECLKALANPPGLLFCKGNKTLLGNQIERIAVVGSRKASPSATKAAFRFGQYLSERNIGVVSGLALGCDTYAHEGCLDQGGKAIAVLPSGADSVVPKQNEELAERIIKSDGILLSELPPGAKATKGTFVSRDRIEAALSRKTIVVETASDGGTMHTANYSKKLGRFVGVYMYGECGNKSGNVKLVEEDGGYSLSSSERIEYFVTALGEEPLCQESLF